MPIKDKTKAREYFKNYMANLRAKEKGLTDEKENVKPNFVKPTADIFVKPIKPNPEVLNHDVKPCANCQELSKQINQLKTEKDQDYEKFWRENENQKSTHKQKLISLYQEITTYKETTNKLQTEKQTLIEKYTRLENNNKNTANFLSMPNLYALINKHRKFQSIQKIYNQQEIKEREFLRNLLDKLWSFS